MKKDEFLAELEEGLRGKLKDSELRDILNDYSGFFDAGVSEGRTEDEVSQELGSPAKTAETIISDSLDKNNANNSIVHGSMSSAYAPIEKRIGAALVDRVIIIFLLLIFTIAGGMLLKYQLQQEKVQVINIPNDGSTTIFVASSANSAYNIPVISGLLFLFFFSSNPAIAYFLYSVIIFNSKLSNSNLDGFQIVLFILFLLLLLAISLYKPLLESIWRGKTLGKKLFGIRVVTESGNRASAGKVFLRELFGDNLISFLTLGATSLVSVFTAAITKKRKSIPDYISGTIVVIDDGKKAEKTREKNRDEI